MKKAVKVLIVLILVSVVFSAPVLATTQPEETPESEDYKKRHEERGERGVPPATPVPTPSAVPGSAIGYNGERRGYTGCCLFATVAHGTPTAEKIDVLRDFRDIVLNQNPVGELLVSAYYDVSPPLAEFIAEHSNLRTIARVGIVEPMIRALELSEGIWNAT